MVLRIGLGLVGLVVIVLGIKQFATGIRELSGKRTTQPQKLGETYTSTENGYTHRFPQGWERKPGPQPGMTMIVAPKESGVDSNMVTTVELLDGSLRAYTDANIKSIRANVPGAKILSDSEFVPDTKVPAYKLKLHNKMQDIDLAQTMYLFDGPSGKKIIVTCTATTEQSPQLESLFDECMKTFALSHP